MSSRQKLFRPQALEQYAQRRQKTVLPRSVTPSVFLVLWLLLGLFLLLTLLVWQAQVPISTAVSGIIVLPEPATPPASDTAMALLFVPAADSQEIHAGQPISIQITETGTHLTGTIDRVSQEAISPDEARQRYTLTGDLALVITQPSVVVVVRLGAPLPAHLSAGERISAQVQVGSQSLLSLLPELLKGIVGR